MFILADLLRDQGHSTYTIFDDWNKGKKIPFFRFKFCRIRLFELNILHLEPFYIFNKIWSSSSQKKVNYGKLQSHGKNILYFSLSSNPRKA